MKKLYLALVASLALQFFACNGDKEDGSPDPEATSVPGSRSSQPPSKSCNEKAATDCGPAAECRYLLYVGKKTGVCVNASPDGSEKSCSDLSEDRCRLVNYLSTPCQWLVDRCTLGVDAEVNKKERQAFLATKSVMQSTFFTSIIKFNTSMTSIYYQSIPPMPILQDDPQDRKFALSPPTMVVSFSKAFASVLPSKIIDKLKENSFVAANIMVAFVAQSNNNLGEQRDHANIPTATCLKAHGWLDPMAPANFGGTRVNRSILLGIFESERDITYPGGVPFNRLMKTPIHVHDNVFSPYTLTNKVKISETSPTTSFWSLAIDQEDAHAKKAIATLHWVLNDQGANSDFAKFKSLLIANDQPKCADFGACLKLLTESSEFKDSYAVTALKSLFL